MVDLQTLKTIGMECNMYKKGEVVLRNGDLAWHKIVFVKAGSLAIYAQFKRSDQRLVGIVGAGGYYGEKTLFTKKPPIFALVAEEDTVTYELDKEDFPVFCAQNPAAIAQMMSDLWRYIATPEEERSIPSMVTPLGTESNQPAEIRKKDAPVKAEVRKVKVEDAPPPIPATVPDKVEDTPPPVPETVPDKEEDDPSPVPVTVSDKVEMKEPREKPVKAGGKFIAKLSRDGIEKLYPKGHKTYRVPHPLEHDRFLVDKTIVCPSCRETYIGVRQLTTNYKPIGAMTCDLRRHYEAITPHWYDVQTCPHCLFSLFDTDLNEDTYVTDEVKRELSHWASISTIDFTVPRDLDTVFAGYYLSLISSPGVDNAHRARARAWRQLGWLYEEAGDEAMLLHATKQAYAFGQEYYLRGRMSEEGRQVQLMILGTTARKLQLYDEAIQYLSLAKSIKEGKRVYTMLIENEYVDIKEERRKWMNQSN